MKGDTHSGSNTSAQATSG